MRERVSIALEGAGAPGNRFAWGRGGAGRRCRGPVAPPGMLLALDDAAAASCHWHRV